MDSNKHGVMEQNEEDITVNISISHMHQTDHPAQSYDAINTAKKSYRNKGHREIRPPLDPDLGFEVAWNPRLTGSKLAGALAGEERRGGRSWGGGRRTTR